MAVGGEVIGSIGAGLVVLAAVERGDSDEQMRTAARKIAELRIFGDAAGKMNLDIRQIGGSVLAVSQFTLAASLERGRRPSFTGAEEPERARELFEQFCEMLRAEGVEVQTGQFRETMLVSLDNDGPVTFVLDVRPG